MDAIEFLDFGTDESTIVAAFEADEIDLNDESSSDFLDVLDGLGLDRKENETAATMVARMRPDEPPFDNQDVRNAVQLAVDNNVLLELGINGQGVVAENHHCAPFHPEYAKLPPVEHNPEKAREMLAKAGHADTEFELISIDGGWIRNTADAISGQLRDAGFNLKRTLMPGNTFWNGWKTYPFSTTNWGPRPLGVQIYVIAYRSGAKWNESGFSNAEFDAKLEEAVGIFDADKRRVLMADMQRMLRESGAIIQPFWQKTASHHRSFVKGYQRHQIREMHFEKVWLDT